MLWPLSPVFAFQMCQGRSVGENLLWHHFLRDRTWYRTRYFRGQKKKSFWKTFPILSASPSSPTAAKQSLQDLGLFWRIISDMAWIQIFRIISDMAYCEANKACQHILLLNACCMLANWHLNSRLDLTSKKLTLDKRLPVICIYLYM